MAGHLALGMVRAGARVNLAPFTLDARGLPGELRELLATARPSASGPVLYSSYLHPELDRYTGRELFVHTMGESSRLPASWPVRLNAACAVIVPTRFAADVCRRSGVEVPVAVVPDGVDLAVYPYLHRLATGVPVLASPSRWFADLTEVTHQPTDPVEGVARLLDNTTLCDRLTRSAREYCHHHTWWRAAEEYAHVWAAVER
jgi:glycosyltransferase involved in cell wall biosynthesis